MTLQDFLNTFSNGDQLEIPHESQRTTEIRRVFFCTDSEGLLHGSCGGQSVIGVEWERNARGLQNRPAYIVVDDSKGEAWDAQRQRGEQPAQHYRPFAKLRMVQSA